MNSQISTFFMCNALHICGTKPYGNPAMPRIRFYTKIYVFAVPFIGGQRSTEGRPPTKGTARCEGVRIDILYKTIRNIGTLYRGATVNWGSPPLQKVPVAVGKYWHFVQNNKKCWYPL